MVVGFNHNFRYKGEVFHVQTEDGGRNTTNIITLLYKGGTILARQKTSYADIAKVDNLDRVVEELMKEQHKDMLRRLKIGEFDARIDAMLAGSKPAPVESELAVAEVPPPVSLADEPPAPAPAPASVPVMEIAEALEEVEAIEEVEEVEEVLPINDEDVEEGEAEFDLDDVILSYLLGDSKK
jgi:hypothetical protein